MKRIFTVGVYDILHVGHIQLFRRARQLGDHLTVAVQNSDYVLKYKPGSQLVYSTEERMFMVKAVRYVDDVVAYDAVDEIIDKVDFDIFVVGPDQVHAGFQSAKAWCEAHGKEIVTLPRTEGISSSWLKEQIRNM